MREGVRPGGRPYTIVIGDDKTSEADMLKRLLEARGYRVLGVFNDGKGLVDWCRENAPEPDLIILDIIMPVLDGFAAFWDLKRLPNLPRVFFLSVENSSQVIKYLIGNGAIDYVTRPYNRTQLLDRIKSAVRKPRG